MTDYGIDWTGHSDYPPDHCECKCGGRWDSHTKTIIHKGKMVIVTEKPCPKCGKNDEIRAVRGDWEQQIIG